MYGTENPTFEPHNDMYITKVTTSKGKNKFLEYVLTNYEQMNSSEITPMFVYKSLNTGETGLIVDAKDTEALSNFVKQKIRVRDEVVSVKVDNLVRPVFLPRPENDDDMKRFAVTASCEPMACKGVYKQIMANLAVENVTITMVAYIMNEDGQHVTMSVITPSVGTLNSFVEKIVTPMQGVNKITVSELAHLRRLSTKFEWNRTVQPIAHWESLIGRDYDDKVYRDVDQGC